MLPQASSARFIVAPPIDTYARFQFERGRQAAKRGTPWPNVVHVSWLQGYEQEQARKEVRSE